MKQGNTRPPIGIIPEYIWREARISELTEAIARYHRARRPVPQEWLDEMKRHEAFIRTKNVTAEVLDEVLDISCNWDFEQVKINGMVYELKTAIPAGAGTANDVLNTEQKWHPDNSEYKKYGTPPNEYDEWDKFICDHGLSMLPFSVDNIQFKGSKVKELLAILREEEDEKILFKSYVYRPAANEVLNTEDEHIFTINFSIYDSWEKSMDMFKSALLKLNIRPNKTTANDVLNTERDWEIIMFENPYGCRSMSAKMFYPQVDKIISVKRLSDNEVFSVGDDVYIDNMSGNKFNFKIGGFRIMEQQSMMATSLSGRASYNISTLKKPTPSQPQNNKERIEIRGFINDKESYEGKFGNVLKVYYPYTFTYETMMKERLPEIKAAIEKILNDDVVNEVTDKGREVVSDLFHFSGSNTGKWYRFHKSGLDLIPHEKFPAIKAAIEKILNDDVVNEVTDKERTEVKRLYFNWHTATSYNYVLETSRHIDHEKHSAIKQAIEKILNGEGSISEEAFNAARRIKKGLYPTIAPMDYEYPRYQDYLNRKNQMQ